MSYTYNGAGDLVRITPELGQPTVMNRDDAGRLTSLIDARGQAGGNDPADFTWRFAYDGSDRPTSLTDPLGNVSQTRYDDAGRPEEQIDAEGRTTSYVYDDAGRLTSIAAPGQGTTSFSYDEVGNLTERIDAEGAATSWTYDRADRAKTYQTPQTFGSMTYLPGGLPHTVTDALGQVTTYSFDNASRLERVDYSAADTPDVSFEYDANSNRTKMHDGAGTETYAFDDLNRLTEITRPGTGTIGYGYDEASNVTQRRYPDGRVIDYGFDANERLASVTQQGAETVYDYDVAGRLSETRYPNGWVDSYAYDRAGRLELLETSRTATGEVLSSYGYTRDGVGNPLSITQAGRMDAAGTDEFGDPVAIPRPDQVTYFLYDDAYRLTAECEGAPCDASPEAFRMFTYDQVGNRLSETTQDASYTFTYNDAHQLTFTDKPGLTNLPRDMSYDALGNLVLDGDYHYEYDQAGSRLSMWYIAAGSRNEISFSYDGDGKRLAADGRCCGGPTRPARPVHNDYLWDPNFSLPMLVATGDEDAPATQTFGNGLVSSELPGEPLTYQHPDGIGSITGVTTADGDAISTWDYEAFGEISGGSDFVAGGSGSVPFGFAGEYQDESGLYHLRARQYDPSVGRFISPDPIPEAPGSNTFSYAVNRPTTIVDPSGLWGVNACVSSSGLYAFTPLRMGAALLGSAEVCVGSTSAGDIGTAITVEGGPGFGFGRSASAGPAVQIHDAERLDELGGWFDAAGANGTAGSASVSGQMSWGESCLGNFIGVGEGGIGRGPGTGGLAWVGKSYTWTHTAANIGGFGTDGCAPPGGATGK